ncbi:MAG: hypothetical protein L6Q71_11390 [Planctomycetes bacterium]|nr:hypothetical protein [Planctomycetota bacterium]
MTRTIRKILEDRRRLLTPERQGPAPFSPDHKVYPQGWSWAMIEREAARRYQSGRDAERAQDWTWAVDHRAVRAQLSKEAVRAAHELYEHQQTAIGDVERVEEVAYQGGFSYLGASWAAARSLAIAENAKRYVLHHPKATEARLLVFDLLFDVRQPTLEEVRWQAGGRRYNAKGKPIRLSQRETADRVVWCCETLADCGAGLDAGYGMAA